MLLTLFLACSTGGTFDPVGVPDATSATSTPPTDTDSGTPPSDTAPTDPAETADLPVVACGFLLYTVQATDSVVVDWSRLTTSVNGTPVDPATTVDMLAIDLVTTDGTTLAEDVCAGRSLDLIDHVLWANQHDATDEVIDVGRGAGGSALLQLWQTDIGFEVLSMAIVDLPTCAAESRVEITDRSAPAASTSSTLR